MFQQIKNRFSGNVIREGDYKSLAELIANSVKNGVNLSGADLCQANLSGVNLSGADLCQANLSGANLCQANLCQANLYEANLYQANLCQANLYEANLYQADLCQANLSGADLCQANLFGADLCQADLSGANLSGANLYQADLSGVNNADLIIAKTLIVPECGSFIGWKKCKKNVIVKLQIQENSKRSNATGRKCRAESVVALEVFGAEYGVSEWDSSTIYRVGETVTCNSWDDNRWIECGGGIHFYLTRIEAENH